jgi:hypothetical protein
MIDQPYLDCIVVMPEDHDAAANLLSLLPPAIPHIRAESGFAEATTAIQRAIADFGLVVCDAARHFDRADVDTWPQRIADGVVGHVGWMRMAAGHAPLTANPRRRCVQVFGPPATDRWGLASLRVDEFGPLPTSGLRIVKEVMSTSGRTGHEHPLSKHLLRSGFAEPTWFRTVLEGDRGHDNLLRYAAAARGEHEAQEGRLGAGPVVRVRPRVQPFRLRPPGLHRRERGRDRDDGGAQSGRRRVTLISPRDAGRG